MKLRNASVKPNNPPIMFHNKFLDRCSKTHGMIPLVFFTPIVLIFIFKAKPNLLSISYFFAGLLFWTFMEYFIHRFIFHWTPKSALLKKFVFIMHEFHHEHPHDLSRLVMPLTITIPLMLLFYKAFSIFIATPYTNIAFSGFLIGYVTYDTMHYALHYFRSKNKLFLKLRKNHYKHHFLDSNSGFGVSQTIWDYLFKTR